MADVIGKILITEEQILERTKEIGAAITKDYEGKELVLIGILKGSIPWMGDVMKTVDLPLTVDFMAVSSYGSGKTSSGRIKIVKDLDSSIEDKDIIIVEDIVDSGLTLSYLKEYLKNLGASSVKICTLLDKPEGRKVDITPDYVGFEVEDLFIVGYGLDYDQKYRNLPYISYLED